MKWLTLVFIYSLCLSPAFSQVRISKLPEEFRNVIENVNVNYKHSVYSPSIWYVYSVNENINTFHSIDKFDFYKTVHFKDRFYVIDESRFRLHIIKANQSDINYIDFTVKNYDDFGWIDKEDLLLWTSALISSESYQYIKALPKRSVINIYNDKSLANQIDQIVGGNKPFFVYSINDKSLLVSHTSWLSDISEFGWVNKNDFFIWNNNVALEPNWNETAYAERKSKNVKAVIFDNLSSCIVYNRSNLLNIKNYVEVDWANDRMNGDYMRYPVLEMVGNEFCKCLYYDKSLNVFKEGYCILKHSKLDYELFVPVTFQTREEIGGCISEISRLLQKKTSNEVRRHLYNTFINLLEDHIGESPAVITQDYSMEYITQVLFGLSSASEYIKGVKLGDLLDATKFSDDDLALWINELEIKLRHLKRIMNEKSYKFSYESNDEFYYWICNRNLP